MERWFWMTLFIKVHPRTTYHDLNSIMQAYAGIRQPKCLGNYFMSKNSLTKNQ